MRVIVNDNISRGDMFRKLQGMVDPWKMPASSFESGQQDMLKRILQMICDAPPTGVWNSQDQHPKYKVLVKIKRGEQKPEYCTAIWCDYDGLWKNCETQLRPIDPKLIVGWKPIEE